MTRHFFKLCPKTSWALVLWSLTAALAQANVQCPVIFGDHMVLQRDRPIAIWGDAVAGEKVSVLFAGQTKTTETAADGHWQVSLDSLPASAESRTLTIQGQNTLTFTDVLVGEVWLCSGQSNMEKPLGPRKGQKPTDNYEAETRAADHPLLRLFQMPFKGLAAEKVTALRWVPCSPETVASTEFSAAGYFFGRDLQRELGVPIGMIHSSYGGTRIETWIPPAAFSRSPSLAAFAEGVKTGVKVDDAELSVLYQSMILPLAPYTLRGFLWYQGEANLLNAETLRYFDKMRVLIEGWREVWKAPEAPFYYVLLAPFSYSRRTSTKPVTDEALPVFWETQIKALSIPHTGLVVTTDLVTTVKDIHPTNKHDVGARLARLALADTYGRKDVKAQGPSYQAMSVEPGGKVILTFRDTDGRLASSDGKPLTDFTLAGADQQFFPAEATIEGDKIILSNAHVTTAKAARFAWKETARPNLVNAANLPALPFRTDDWPIQVEKPADTAANPPAETK